MTLTFLNVRPSLVLSQLMSHEQYLSWEPRKLSSVCLSPSPCQSSYSEPWPDLSGEWSARSAGGSSSCWLCCSSSPPAPPAPSWRCCCCWRWCCTSPGSPPGRTCPWTWHCRSWSSWRTSAWSPGHSLSSLTPSHLNIHHKSLCLTQVRSGQVRSQLWFRPPQSQFWQINLPVRETTDQLWEFSVWCWFIFNSVQPRSQKDSVLETRVDQTSRNHIGRRDPEQSVSLGLGLILSRGFCNYRAIIVITRTTSGRGNFAPH